MDSKYFHKTKSPEYTELNADRGHPGPNDSNIEHIIAIAIIITIF